MEVKSSSGMLIDDARGEMAVQGCFRAPWGGPLATVPDQIKAVSAQPSARNRRWKPQAEGCGATSLRPLPAHIINNSVFLALFGGHDVIPLRILLNPLDRLPGVHDQDVVDPLPHPQDSRASCGACSRISGRSRRQ